MDEQGMEGFDEEMSTEQMMERLVDPFEQSRLKQAEPKQLGSAARDFVIQFGVLAAIGGGFFLAAKAFMGRMDDLVEGYGEEMASISDASVDVLTDVTRQYKRKLGPGVRREEMFRKYVMETVRRQTLSIASVRGMKHTLGLFRYNDAKFVDILLRAVSKFGKKSPGLASKILFYGERLTEDGSKPYAALQPIRDYLAEQYEGGGKGTPAKKGTGAQIVAKSQLAMAEAVFRDSLPQEPEKLSAGMALPEGYELLGLTEEKCRALISDMLAPPVKKVKKEKKAAASGEEGEEAAGATSSTEVAADDEEEEDGDEKNWRYTFARKFKPRKKGRTESEDKDSEPEWLKYIQDVEAQQEAEGGAGAVAAASTEVIPEDADALLDEPESDESVSAVVEGEEAPVEATEEEPEAAPSVPAKAYECGGCGYTMFVAPGREFKFYGDDFKCPECGAEKSQFTEREVGGAGDGD
jgi:rubredoxin